jgi:hypothetical protein
LFGGPLSIARQIAILKRSVSVPIRVIYRGLPGVRAEAAWLRRRKGDLPAVHVTA